MKLNDRWNDVEGKNIDIGMDERMNKVIVETM